MGITKIWERLYLGSLNDAAQLAGENPFGITAVVSLCSHKVPREAKGVSYARIVIAESSPISARQFDAVMAAIAQGVRHGKLLIHCAGGVNRSPIMAAAWLHRCGCLNLVEALLAIKERRPIIDPSPVLLRSVVAHLRR
jgi:protein-tyrosine phosphatase